MLSYTSSSQPSIENSRCPNSSLQSRPVLPPFWWYSAHFLSYPTSPDSGVLEKASEIISKSLRWRKAAPLSSGRRSSQQRCPIEVRNSRPYSRQSQSFVLVFGLGQIVSFQAQRGNREHWEEVCHFAGCTRSALHESEICIPHCLNWQVSDSMCKQAAKERTLACGSFERISTPRCGTGGEASPKYEIVQNHTLEIKLSKDIRSSKAFPLRLLILFFLAISSRT